jgi:hypothetical protein
VFVGLWIVGLTAISATVGWFVAEGSSEAELFVPAEFTIIAAIVTGLLLLGPALVLYAVARSRAQWNPGSSAAARAWALAAGCGAVLGCVRAVPLPQNELLLGLSAVVAAGLGVLVRRSAAAGGRQTGAQTRVGGYLVALGLLMLTPWALFGALGGVVETVAAAALAIAVGYLGTGILNRTNLASYGRSRAWSVLVGGLSAGVALAPLAVALGAGPGVNLAELLTVPAVGFAVGAAARVDAGISTARQWWRPSPVGLLLAATVFGPVAFLDPEETSLVLGPDDVLKWATYAAVLGLLVALAVGLAYGLVLRRGPRWLPAALGALALVVCAGAYAGPGQPGFYGDRLFVVMAQQADLTGLAAIPDRAARLTATYRRLVQTADTSQASLRHELDTLHIGYTPYYLVNGLLVDAGPALRPFLSGQSGVDRVLLDQRLRALPAPAPDEVGSDPAPADDQVQWNIKAIQAPAVWATGDTGQGITIGTSDTGVDGSHPRLSGGYRGGDDSWYDPWNGSAQPTDHIGHGTHTIGTALGRDGIGVAPGAQWMGCVNLDRNYGSPSHYLDCLQYMLAPFPPGGSAFAGNPDRAADILTNSWGCPAIEGCDLDSLRPATDALTAAGIYVVVAAGNNGPGCGTVTDPPAPYPSVLTVGATDTNNQLADFSSRGPTPDGQDKPDVVAPGVDVLSSLPHGTYAKFEGTSMATPHVAGVVALMWSANPKLIGDIADTTAILRRTATKLPQHASDTCGAPSDETGAGLVNADAAVQAARAF